MDRYESHADRQIREALERGEFDALPGRGKPLRDLHLPYQPGWWARRWIERERTRDALHEVAAETERALGRLWTLPDEGAVRREVAKLNRHLEEANSSVSPEDRLPSIDPSWATETWRRMAGMRIRTR